MKKVFVWATVVMFVVPSLVYLYDAAPSFTRLVLKGNLKSKTSAFEVGRPEAPSATTLTKTPFAQRTPSDPNKSDAGLKEFGPLDERTKRGILIFKEAASEEERAHSEKEFDSAAEKYEKAAEFLRGSQFHEAVATAFAKLGKAYSQLNRDEKGEDYLKRSLVIYKAHGNLAGQTLVLYNLGILEGTRKRYEKAAEYFETALPHLGELGERNLRESTLQKLADLYEELGSDYRKNSQFPKAEVLFLKLLSTCDKLNDSRCRASALGHLGQICTEIRQYAKARDYLHKSLTLFRDMKDMKAQAAVYSDLGILYYQQRDFVKAVQHYKKSLALSEEGNDAAGCANSLNNLGVVYTECGDLGQAMQCIRKSADWRRKTDDKKSLAATINNVGQLFHRLGLHRDAVMFFNQAIAFYEESNNEREKVEVLLNLANVYFDWGRYQEAQKRYLELQSLFHDLKHSEGEALALKNLGRVLGMLGSAEKKIEFCSQALEIERKIEDPLAQAYTIMWIGDAYASQGNYREALDNYRNVLNIFERIGVDDKETKGRMGELYLAMGQIDQAKPYVDESQNGLLLARLELLKSNYPAAQEHFEHAMTYAERHSDAKTMFVAYTGLGMTFEGMNNVRKAAEFYGKAVNLTEQLRSSLSIEQRARFFNTQVNGFYRTDPYKGLARTFMKLNRRADALKISEYTKARALSEAMSSRYLIPESDVPADVFGKDEELHDQISALSKQRQQAYEKLDDELVKSLDAKILQLERNLSAHVKMLREKHPLFAATKYPQPMGLEQTALKDDEWVLAYDMTDTGLIIYLTRGKTVVKGLFKPIPSKELKAQVQEFMEPLHQAKPMDFDLKASRKLAETLLGDVLPAVPEAVPLIIVPDDCLGAVPFEALVLNEDGKVLKNKEKPYPHVYVSGAKFFGDRNRISYQQSITALTLARLYGTKKKLGEKLLVMADPVFRCDDERAAGLCESTPKRIAKFDEEIYTSVLRYMGGKSQRLAETAKLAEGLKKLFSDKAEVYEGLDVNKARFFRDIAPHIGDFRQIVFATHGDMGKDLPGTMEPVLMFSLLPPGTDGYLRQSEVMGRLKMNADVVALTACESGLGKELGGEGVMSMGRAFQYAGARSVLMSLWSVAEVPSIKLTESFFKHLKDGKPKLEALQLARSEIRKAGYDHPFFWAAFILVGEAN